MTKCRKAAISFSAVGKFYRSTSVLASKVFIGYIAGTVNPRPPGE